jgi:hypothetical protein
VISAGANSLAARTPTGTRWTWRPSTGRACSHSKVRLLPLRTLSLGGRISPVREPSGRPDNTAPATNIAPADRTRLCDNMVRTRLADAHHHAVPRRPLQRRSLLFAASFIAELGGTARAQCTPSADCETAGSCAACSFRGVCSAAGLCVCDRGWGNHPCSNRCTGCGIQSMCVNAENNGRWTPTTHANVICDHCASPRPSD